MSLVVNSYYVLVIIIVATKQFVKRRIQLFLYVHLCRYSDGLYGVNMYSYFPVFCYCACLRLFSNFIITNYKTLLQ